MTEKHCESVNECANGELCAMLKNSAGLTLVGCSHFKPKQPMTNEEWLKSANTEQLAGFLSKIEEQYPCGSLLKCDVTCGYHSQCRGDDVAPTNKEAWVEWLKQPHRGT